MILYDYAETGNYFEELYAKAPIPYKKIHTTAGMYDFTLIFTTITWLVCNGDGGVGDHVIVGTVVVVLMMGDACSGVDDGWL